MKRNSIFSRITGLGASLLLMLAAPACVDTTTLYEAGADDAGAAREVTLLVEPQLLPGGTRAVKDGETASEYPHISDGTKADLLIYEVYKVTKDEDGNETYELDKRFGKQNTVTFGDGSYKAPEGQTYVKVTSWSSPVKITLAIAPGEDYRVAFWLQSHETKAYDTSNGLTKVEVKYKDGENAALNNDELRDAFSNLSDVINPVSTNNKVTLYRVLAQVNVGTAGWDYEGAAILRPSQMSYTQSRITIGGVARYYNAVARKSLSKEELEDSDGEALTDVTFEYNRLPAFIHLSDAERQQVGYEPVASEEFLYVDLNGDEGYLPYLGWAAKFGTDATDVAAAAAEGQLDDPETPADPETPTTSEIVTETFKYLSMCYVLAPETSVDVEVGKTTGDETRGGVVSVKFEAKGFEIPETDGTDDPAATDADVQTPAGKEDAGEIMVFALDNVPVRKNWRTNILGENFFLYNQAFRAIIVSDYSGNYNYPTDDPTTGGVEWPQEGGVGYHALWFTNSQLQYKEISYTANHKTEDPTTYDSYAFSSSDSYRFFHLAAADNQTDKYGTATYDGQTYTYGKKLNQNGVISFTTDSVATVIIVQSLKTKDSNNNNVVVDCDRGITFNGKNYPISSASQPSGSSNCYVHTFKDLPAGEYKITRGDSNGNGYETGIFYVKVQYQSTLRDDTIDSDDDFDEEYGEDYYPSTEGDGNNGDNSGSTGTGGQTE